MIRTPSRYSWSLDLRICLDLCAYSFLVRLDIHDFELHAHLDVRAHLGLCVRVNLRASISVPDSCTTCGTYAVYPPANSCNYSIILLFNANNCLLCVLRTSMGMQAWIQIVEDLLT